MDNQDKQKFTQEKMRLAEKKQRPLSSLSEAYHKGQTGSLIDLTSSLSFTMLLIILGVLLLIGLFVFL